MAKKREKSPDAATIEKAKTSENDDFMLSDEELDKVAGGVAAINVTSVRGTIGNIGGTVLEPSLDPNGGTKMPDSFKSGGF